VDAQGRGGAGDEIDPADQWVYNPDTGDYELRVSNPHASYGQQSQQGRHASQATPSRQDVPPRQRRGPESTQPLRPGTGPRPGPDSDPDRPLPGQRDRRAAPHSRRKPKAKKARSRKKKALMWVGGGLAMLLITGCALAGYMYWRLNANLTTTEVVGEETGYNDGEPVNVLFIGTDNRQGENAGYGNEGDSGRADTTVLMHFSAEREHASGLSIPRDLITDIPECEVKNGNETTVIPASEDVRFNESLGVGGRDPGCVWRTVEQITGVEIDHYIMADFNAVKEMSSAVGGVPVCLEEPIDDPKSHLQLDAGDHELEGEDALAFVRTRYSVGTGSDLSRIELQQQFLASLAREINSIGFGGFGSKMWDLADAATKALTVDSGIGSVRKLYDLSKDLGKVPMKDMAFLTVPVVDNTDGATVLIDEANAEPIFEMLQQDISMTDDGKKAGGGNGGNQQMSPPEDVRVDVYNGGEVLGAAQETVTWLQNEKGVPLSTNAGNAAEPQEQTTLEFGPDQADQAARLADMMGLKKRMLHEGTENAGDEPMVLILGNDFNGAGEPVGGPPRKPDSVESITADEEVCAS
jgi:LCP family protein required for cell wall assembly